MDRNRLLEVHEIVERMRKNSKAWNTASPAERVEFHEKNENWGNRLRGQYGIPTVYCEKDGVWYVGQIGVVKLYDLY